MVSKFMDNEKTDNYYIKKIIGHLENIVEFLNGIDEESFYNSKVVQSAVCFEFVQIYENAKEIDNFLNYRGQIRRLAGNLFQIALYGKVM